MKARSPEVVFNVSFHVSTTQTQYDSWECGFHTFGNMVCEGSGLSTRVSAHVAKKIRIWLGVMCWMSGSLEINLSAEQLHQAPAFLKKYICESSSLNGQTRMCSPSEDTSKCIPLILDTLKSLLSSEHALPVQYEELLVSAHIGLDNVAHHILTTTSPLTKGQSSGGEQLAAGSKTIHSNSKVKLENGCDIHNPGGKREFFFFSGTPGSAKLDSTLRPGSSAQQPLLSQFFVKPQYYSDTPTTAPMLKKRPRGRPKGPTHSSTVVDGKRKQEFTKLPSQKIWDEWCGILPWLEHDKDEQGNIFLLCSMC